MLRSMTAFARHETEGDWGHLVWELRSYNHRYLDIQVRLPDDLRGLEADIRERVAAFLRRGKVECQLRWQAAAGTGRGLNLDRALAEAIVNLAGQVQDLAVESGPLRAVDLLRWPGVVRETGPDLEPVRAAALQGLDVALSILQHAREREGERTRQYIANRCDAVGEQVRAARTRLPEALTALRERLRRRLAEVASGPDPERLEQELALAAQKLDVDEELARLEGHIHEVRAALDAAEPVGRRLDFLMQELNREANTLASKAADRGVTQASVELKVLIEQMREQVQNVE